MHRRSIVGSRKRSRSSARGVSRSRKRRFGGHKRRSFRTGRIRKTRGSRKGTFRRIRRGSKRFTSKRKGSRKFAQKVMDIMIPPRETVNTLALVKNYGGGGGLSAGIVVEYDMLNHNSSLSLYSGALVTTYSVTELADWANTFQSNLGFSQLAVGGNTVALNSPIYWHSSCVYYKLTNLTNIKIQLTLYYCMVRHDVQNISSKGNPLVEFYDGLANKGDIMLGSRGSNQFNEQVTPFDSPDFTHLYKIYRVKKFLLSAGRIIKFSTCNKRSRIFRLSDYYSRISTSSTLASSTLTVSLCRGSKFIMAAWKPQLVVETSSGLSSSPNFSLQWEATIKNKFQFSTSPQSTITQLSNEGIVPYAAGDFMGKSYNAVLPVTIV